jgi:hypothetical protein
MLCYEEKKKELKNYNFLFLVFIKKIVFLFISSPFFLPWRHGFLDLRRGCKKMKTLLPHSHLSVMPWKKREMPRKGKHSHKCVWWNYPMKYGT